MRNVASLLEPILLHLPADKTKERSDALTRLKAILDGDPGEFCLGSDLAGRLVLAFVKMMRLECKGCLMGAAQEELTSVQSNKLQNLMKDMRWLLMILDRSFPSTNYLTALPDLYNFLLDALESSFSLLHTETLSILKSCILSRKTYLLELRPDHWERIFEIMHAFVVPEEGAKHVSISTESDIISCMFFLVLGVPNDVWTWPQMIMQAYDILLALLSNTLRRNHENPTMCLLFRAINYCLQELKLRDPINYQFLLDETTPIMLRFQPFKSAVIAQDHYLFFLSNQIPSDERLHALAESECSKSRLKPAELDPIKLCRSMKAYMERDHSYCFPKGYLSFIIGVHFSCQYLNREARGSLDSAIGSKISSDERLSTFLFRMFTMNDISLDYLIGKFESSLGAKKSWLTAMIMAKLITGDYTKEQVRSLFQLFAGMLIKKSSIGLVCPVLTMVLYIEPDLVHEGPKIGEILEAIGHLSFTEDGLGFLHVYFGLKYRGLWWTRNAVRDYKLLTEMFVYQFEIFGDPKYFVEQLILSADSFASLFSIPLRKSFITKSDCLNGSRNEILDQLPVSNFRCSFLPISHFEAVIDDSVRHSYIDILHSFRRELVEQIKIVGFQTCKIMLQNIFMMNAKEETFADAVLQLFDTHMLLKAGISLPPYQSIAAAFDVQQLIVLEEAILNVDLSAEDIASLSQRIILSFRFFEHKKSAKKEFSNSSSTISQQLHIHPYAFLNHCPEKDNIIKFAYLRILIILNRRIPQESLNSIDAETRVFLEEFPDYLREQLKRCLSSSVSFITLIGLFETSMTNAAEMLKSAIFKKEDLAAVSMSAVIAKALKEAGENEKIMEFASSMVKKYLKWNLSPDAKGKILQLVVLLSTAGILDDETIWSVLLDPAAYAADNWEAQLKNLLRCLKTDYLKEQFQQENGIWTSSSCLGEAMTKLKLMRILLTDGVLDFELALSSLVFGFPENQMQQFSTSSGPSIELKKLVSERELVNIGASILCQWIRRGKRSDLFPSGLFSVDLSSLMLDPLVFGQLCMTIGPLETYDLYKPSPEMLQVLFPRLVGVAFFHHFTDQFDQSDAILTKILKNNLADGAFESCFRDNILEIIAVVIELSCTFQKEAVVHKCLDHIASLFRYDGTASLYCPAYMAHVSFVLLKNLPIFSEKSLGLTQFVIEKCPDLLKNEIIRDKIRTLLIQFVDNSKLPPPAYLGAFLNKNEILMSDAITGKIMGKLLNSRSLLEEWMNGPFKERAFFKQIVHVVQGKSLRVELIGTRDELISELLLSAPLEISLAILEIMYNQKTTMPKTFAAIKSLAANGLKIPAKFMTYFTSKVADSSEERANPKRLHIQQDDVVEEVVKVLLNWLECSDAERTRPILTALTQLVNSESVWNSIGIESRRVLEFLKVPGAPKRFLLPKSRSIETEFSFETLLISPDVSPNWARSFLSSLCLTFSKNILWNKIGYVFRFDEFSTDLIPAVFEDCFFAAEESKQLEMLLPIQNVIKMFDQKLHSKIFPVLAAIIERILARRNPGQVSLDFKTLGNIMIEQKLTDPIRSLYFFELGLGNFSSLNEVDCEKLEFMYASLGADEYKGCFSSKTRLDHINQILNSILYNDTKVHQIVVNEEKESIWELQKWDLIEISESFSLDQSVIDEGNLMKALANDKISDLKTMLDFISERAEGYKGNGQILAAAYHYSETQMLNVANNDQLTNVDLCLLSLRPVTLKGLGPAVLQIFQNMENEKNSGKLSRTFKHLENIASNHQVAGNEGLKLVMEKEKAKLLWEKGAASEAIGLLKARISSLQTGRIDDVFLREQAALAYTLIGDWTFQSRSEQPLSIKENYLDVALRIIGTASSNPKTLAQIYGMYAKFVDHMFDQMSRDENLEGRERLVKQAKKNLDALVQMGSREENVLRAIRDTEKQYKSDLAEYEAANRSRTSFLLLAVENYLRCLQLVDTADVTIFRVVALWLEHGGKLSDLSIMISTSIGKVPCHKFLPLIYQLAARSELSEMRTSEASTLFQETLERLLYRMAMKHPFHCLYQILALKHGTKGPGNIPSKRKLVYTTESMSVRRAAAAGSLLTKLKSGDVRISGIVEGIEALCLAYIELADYDLPSDTRTNVRIKLDPKWTIGKIASRLPASIAVPTKALAIDPSGRYDNITAVNGFGDGFKVVGGINLPKIIECVGSDGLVYRQLVKGKDDVRQDAVMEQVFGLVDQLLKSSPSTRKSGLGIRTYRIIPLHALAGLIEWVSDTVPLGEYVLPAHERLNTGDVSVREAKNTMKAVWDDPSSSLAKKLKVYQSICSNFRPALRHFFWETARGPEDWWERRKSYVSSCASSSMLGHVVGLGDRHCQNILLDKKTGEMIQIDLNMIFELGKTLRVPERVPFRLTRDIVDGMGPAGTAGGFTKAAEETLKLLRSQADTILMILAVFKHDPLYRWSVNPLKLTRARKDLSLALTMSSSGENGSESEEHSEAPPEADRVLLRVGEKLRGFEEGGGVQLSEAGQVRFLIHAATSEESLCQMYIGWQPWV